jgi:hypothetical protein
MNRDQLKNRLQQTRINQLASSNKQPNQFPSKIQMAKNIGQSIVRNVTSVAAGNGLKISEEDAQSRLAICRGCDFFNKDQERCTKCGCYMATKTYLKAEKCPIGKW